MLKKYTVEYSLVFRKHSPPEHHHFFTDDPTVCEDFIQELLSHGRGLHAIKHDGVDIAPADFDRMVKLAASEIAAKLICTSLHIKPDEERFRFGFAG